MDEIAIIMAAGLGSRMLPLTENTAKPLLEVQGTPMIETIIEGIKYRGIKEIYIVVGYFKEQFQYLNEKYEGIVLVENKEYKYKNNISSLKAVGDILGSKNCFICEADLYVKDKTIFGRNVMESCYYGKMVSGYSDDWVFKLDGDRVVKIGIGGRDCYNMVGISYWRKEDSAVIKKEIDRTYHIDGHEELFWDEIVDNVLEDIYVKIESVDEEIVIEIDTPQELKEMNSQATNI